MLLKIFFFLRMLSYSWSSRIQLVVRLSFSLGWLKDRRLFSLFFSTSGIEFCLFLCNDSIDRKFRRSGPRHLVGLRSEARMLGSDAVARYLWGQNSDRLLWRNLYFLRSTIKDDLREMFCRSTCAVKNQKG